MIRHCLVIFDPFSVSIQQGQHPIEVVEASLGIPLSAGEGIADVAVGA
jgi:hypothetical protein